MSRNATIAAVVIAAGMSIGAAYPSLAAPDARENRSSETQAALSAKVPMESAIKAAEAQTGGRAIEASFGNENGQLGYDVTTITKDGSEKSVFVDAASGKVTTSVADSENENDDGEAGGQENGGD